MVRSGALRGTGDTRYPLIIGATGMWTAVTIVWAVLTFWGGELATVWTAFLFTSPITALVTWLRFRVRVRELAAEM
jgi:Na+-driven multidrug efflux pump